MSALVTYSESDDSEAESDATLKAVATVGLKDELTPANAAQSQVTR